MLSIYSRSHPVTEVDRWDTRQKECNKPPCPALVRKYNKNIGWLDLLDLLIAMCLNKKKRNQEWYHQLGFLFVNQAIVTAWLLYRGNCNSVP